MDTITEYEMAIALAREGGIGIIHRFMTIEDQLEQVLKVKRSESVIIEQPYTIKSSASVDEANRSMNEYGISGLIVVNEEKKLVGIITRRDITFEENPSRQVSELMSKDVITANDGITTNQAKDILHKYRLEKLPVVDDKKKNSRPYNKQRYFENGKISLRF